MAQIPGSRSTDSGKMGITFSGIIERIDRNFKDQIKETNDKPKRYLNKVAIN